jgi:hypothetical protein
VLSLFARATVRASGEKAASVVRSGAGNAPSVGKWLDLEMLMLPGGKERTEEEYRALFAGAGFRVTRVVQTKSPLCVIEAVKAS